MGRLQRIVVALVVTVAVGVVAGRSAPVQAAPRYSYGISAAYMPTAETLEVFSVDQTGALKGVWKQKNSIWRPPFHLTGPGVAPPGAGVSAIWYAPHKTFEVFFVGNDGGIKGVWKDEKGPWRAVWDVSPPGVAPAGAPITAIYTPGGRMLEVFVIGKDGGLKEVWKGDDGKWRPVFEVTPAGFVAPGTPVAASWYSAHRTTEVFATGQDGGVKLVWRGDDGKWRPPFDLTRPGVYAPGAPLTAVDSIGAKFIEVFGVASDGTLKSIWKGDDGKWRDPFNLSDKNLAEAGSYVTGIWYWPGKMIEVFVVGTDGGVKEVWRGEDGKWRPPFNVTPRDVAPAGVQIAAAVHAFNNALELFAVNWDLAVRGTYRDARGTWHAPFYATGAALGPVFSPGDCTAFLRRWSRGYDDDFKMENCSWIMGIQQYCAARDAFTSMQWYDNQTRRYIACTPYARPQTVLEEIETIAEGVAQGLAEAYVAAAPFLQPAISGLACVNGVLYACAVLALDLANAAGANLGSELYEALAIVEQVKGCVDGNIASCGDLGMRGARELGIDLEIPGLDAGKIAADARRCAGKEFAACVRLGLAAADAGGVPIGLGPGAASIEDCLSGNQNACVGLGKDAARAAGFPLNGVLRGVENAQRCQRGDTAACTALGRALIGSGAMAKIDDATRCSNGNTNACISLAREFVGSGIAQGVSQGLDCQAGQQTACVNLGRKLASLYAAL